MLKASEHKGVGLYKGDKWQARLRKDGMMYARGPFDTPEEAFYARREMHSAVREGREVPNTHELKLRMAELSDGQVVSEVRSRGGDRRSTAFRTGTPGSAVSR